MKIDISTWVGKLVSVRKIKGIVMQSMLMAGVIFIIGFNPIKNYDQIIQDPKGRSWLLLVSILLYASIYLIFHKGLKLVLRYFFHSKLREKVRNERNQLLRNITYSDKKDSYLFSVEISMYFYKYFLKMGLITTNDLKTPFAISVSQKEDFFNEILEDQYSWILLIFHSLITTIIVFNFYSWWFIVIMILAIVIMLFFVFVTVYILMNLEYLELIRKQLLKQSINLM